MVEHPPALDSAIDKQSFGLKPVTVALQSTNYVPLSHQLMYLNLCTAYTYLINKNQLSLLQSFLYYK